MGVIVDLDSEGDLIKGNSMLYTLAGLYIIMLLGIVYLIPTAYLLYNDNILLLEENECLKSNKTINEVLERRCDYQLEIIEYLECEVGECVTLRREYEKKYK